MHMKQWDKSNYEDVAHSVLDHSSRKGYEDSLKFLRIVSNFNKSRSERIPPEGLGDKGTVRWEIRSTREYIIETPDGKLVIMEQQEIEIFEPHRIAELKEHLFAQERDMKDELRKLWQIEKESEKEQTVWRKVEPLSTYIFG